MFISKNEGYYSLTTPGKLLCLALVLLLLVSVAFFSGRKKRARMNARQLAFSAAALSLAFLLSFLQPYKLPWGGSVTFFSMLFICLVGNWYGLRTGLTVAFTFSLLQFLQDGGSFILSPLQVCCDYFFAFTALGLSGLFSKRKNGLLFGYLFGVLVRGIFHSLGGYLFWMDYMPDNFPKSLAFLYPIIYNYSFLVIEAVATVLVLNIPAVRKALGRIKKQALL